MELTRRLCVLTMADGSHELSTFLRRAARSSALRRAYWRQCSWMVRAAIVRFHSGVGSNRSVSLWNWRASDAGFGFGRGARRGSFLSELAAFGRGSFRSFQFSWITCEHAKVSQHLLLHSAEQWDSLGQLFVSRESVRFVFVLLMPALELEQPSV